MIQVKGMDHLNLTVQNIEKTRAFYEKLFGFSVKESGVRGKRRWAILGLASKAYLCLTEIGPSDPPEFGASVSRLNINHWGFNVGDFDGMLKTLEKLEIPVEYGGPVEYPKSRSAYVVDPNGYEIELTETFGGGLR